MFPNWQPLCSSQCKSLDFWKLLTKMFAIVVHCDSKVFTLIFTCCEALFSFCAFPHIIFEKYLGATRWLRYIGPRYNGVTVYYTLHFFVCFYYLYNLIVEGLDKTPVYHKTYPQATQLPDGPYAHAMTQVVGIVTACSLFVVNASHTNILPSWKYIQNMPLCAR